MPSNETLSQNDALVCDDVEGVIQSVTELCVSEDSNKKPAAEEMPNSAPEQVEIINEVAEAMPNSVPEQWKSPMKLAPPMLMFVVLWLVTMLKLQWLLSMKIEFFGQIQGMS